MRKFYAAIFCLFTLFYWSTKSAAQVSLYTFVQSSTTYTPASGATTVIASGWDDNNATVTLPFSFSLNGTPYTSIVVNSNGNITFGAVPPVTTNYTPISVATGYNGAVSAFGRDLISNASTIDQATIGSSPNRQFVVQWNNARRYNGGGVVGDVLNFQIILYETSNVIQVVYGTNTATNATPLTGQVGLRGATNADFNNRSTATDWSATTAGVVNTASCTTTNTIMPASGLTFTWLPPSPCSPGSMIGGTTTGPSSFCAGGTFTLSVTGASIGTGLTFTWETSPDGVAWSPAPGVNNNTTYVASISANTYFRRKMTCSATDAYSTPLFVTVSNTATPLTETFATYLTVFPPACWSSNNTGFITGQAPSAYGFGAGSAKFDLYTAAAGTQLDLTSPVLVPVPASYRLTFDHAYATFTNQVDQLQILYSTDGGTTYTTLTTYLGGTTGPLNTIGGTGATTNVFAPTADQWANKAVNLPVGTNRVRFRVISAFGNNLFIDNITIEPIPTCLPPTNLTATGVTPTSATLNWTASTSNPSNGYQWEVRTSGAPGSGATGLTTSGSVGAGVTTANAAGLTFNTTYSFYVRSDCGGGNLSAWTLPGRSFITPCNAFALPFIEPFTSVTFPPVCWSSNNTTLLTRNAVSSYGVGTGSAKYDFYTAGVGVNLDLVTPPFGPVSGTYFLVFDHAYATFAGENDQLQILYSTNGGASYTNLTTYNGGTSGPLNTGGANFAAFTPTATQWATKIIALPAGTNRLVFRGVSAFGNNLYLDNIIITSCVPPTGLGLSAISPTTATVSWTASTSNPSNGYQWEVRTSGAAGSGATGLVASGNTAAGVTSANVAGLTPTTTYNLYVRSDCSAGDFSTWVGPYTFVTPCNPITTPFTETFATYATTFPPTCWTRNNTTQLVGDAASAYGVGLGSAKFDFYAASAGTNLDLVSPLFTPVPAGWRVTFDHAYATFFGENDQLQIFYSTDGGGTYTSLIIYDGGTSGPLNTGGAVLPAFTPTAGQWTDKAVDLPVGTNRLRFRGISAFGNNLYLDNITVEQTPSCLPVSKLSAQPISPSEILVTFTPPATTPTVGYIVEYGPPGFIPGTGATAGPLGTIGAIVASSPATLSGLTASTNYDIYVRKICIAGVDFSVNKKTTATTLCPATNIPYLQNFESATVPGMPTCTSKQDVNGASGSFWLGTGGGSWETYTDANPLTYVSPSKALLYYYDFNDLTRGGDDWFYIQGLNLTAGTNYRLKFFYKALDGANFPEKLEVKYGTKANAANMTTGTLFTNNNISSAYANPYDSVRADFTPPATGVYYIGFHVMSDPDEFGILMDDISVKLAPLVDVGISGITVPSLTCPTSNVFVQATVTNYNTTTVNFATTPVNVTATITGAATGTLTALLNTGSLAPGASMTIYLSPAFDFTTGGLYNITVATSTTPVTNDPETGNDSYSISIVVNPNPPVPVITPPNPAVCAGTPVQLSTQFLPPPPPVVLSFPSGTISVPVPDGSAAGATHSLTVTGVPAGATITGVSVTINMNHTWVGDMIFNLKAPNGRIINLDKYLGGTDAAGVNFVNTVISSPPATGPNYPALNSAPAPRTGIFRPDLINNAVAVSGIQNPNGYPSDAASFNDLAGVPNGTWTLAMADGVGFDVGTLTSWTLTITYQVLTPTITWTPATGLYTNAAATTAYTGGNAYSLYANPAGTTTYTVTATTAAGCTSSASTTVTVNPFPVVTLGTIPDTVCISDPVIALPATPIGGSWTGIGVSGNTFIPPSTAVGTYTLTYTYTSPAGCTTTATRKIAVKDCPERMILLRDNALLLYPNPNTGRFNIKVNSVLYNNLVMKVYTNNGVLVRTQQLGGLAWGRIVPIDLTSLPGGVYMVKFYYDGGARTAEKTFKVIIAMD